MYAEQVGERGKIRIVSKQLMLRFYLVMRIESKENIKNFSFLLLCLVEIEKWKNRKLFYLVFFFRINSFI